MKDAKNLSNRDGMVLIDNYWIEEAEAEKYLADRAEAAQKATAAMRTFCHSVELQWSESEDGEAVVGFNEYQAIRSVIHLDPRGVQLILSLSHDQLVDYLK